MKQCLRLVGVILLACIIGACATMGLQPAKTFEDHVANAYAALTAARDTSTTMAQAGKISKEDFSDFIHQCDSAREAIEAARVIHRTDVTAGEQRLEVAIALLSALNAYLAKREAGPPAQPEVTSYENRRRPVGFDHSSRSADQGSAIVCFATAGCERRSFDQFHGIRSVGTRGRCCARASTLAA